MAKSLKRIEAQQSRQKGESIKEIAKKLNVSKSTASIWCRDIILTRKQIERLKSRIATKGSYENRLRGARVQRERRLKEVEQLQRSGFDLIGSISRKEMLLVGVALYWGEGAKKEGRARIVNSDPEMIKFIINWFQVAWKIPKNQFTLHISINKIHYTRIHQVEKYWSDMLQIPLGQFTKTTLIKSKNKKKYF